MMVAALHCVMGRSFFSLAVFEGGGILILGILSFLLPQLEVLGPSLDKGLYVGVALAKGGEGRQSHDSICRKMVWLELIIIQEVPEKVTHWESESSLKVSSEYYPLSGLGCRHYFVGGKPA
jgi:hypothetical protein